MKSRAKHKYDLSSRRRRKKKTKIWGATFLFLLVAAGVLFFLRWSETRIESITVTSEDPYLTQELEIKIKQKAENILSGYYLWVIPRDNMFFYPQDELKEELLSSFPAIWDLDIGAAPWDGLSIEIKTREPVAIWCLGEECFFVDKDGLVFERALEVEDYMKLEGPIAGDPIGERFCDAETLIFLQKVFSDLRDLELEVAKISLSDLDKAEAALGDGSVVIFSLDPDKGDEFINNLSTFFNSFKEKNGGELPSFEYVDMRYGSKIFYKLK